MAFLCPLGKLSLELTLFLPLHGLLGPAWVLRGNPRAAGLSLLSLTQGQLELLRRLFTEALYEEALSQVSAGRWNQWPPSHSSPLGATRVACLPGTAKREQTWSYGVGVALTHNKLPQQSCIRKRSKWLPTECPSPFSPQWFTPDGFRSLFALVGTNGQGIGTRLGENVPELLDLSLGAGVGD